MATGRMTCGMVMENLLKYLEISQSKNTLVDGRTTRDTFEPLLNRRPFQLPAAYCCFRAMVPIFMAVPPNAMKESGRMVYGAGGDACTMPTAASLRASGMTTCATAAVSFC
jgi:hypothetical protein